MIADVATSMNKAAKTDERFCELAFLLVLSRVPSEFTVKARMVVPAQMIPGLIAALQENFRLYQESFGPPKGPLH